MKPWPKGTICVVENWIVAGANENKFSRKRIL